MNKRITFDIHWHDAVLTNIETREKPSNTMTRKIAQGGSSANTPAKTLTPQQALRIILVLHTPSPGLLDRHAIEKHRL
jgi:hypothetical protein